MKPSDEVVTKIGQARKFIGSLRRSQVQLLSEIRIERAKTERMGAALKSARRLLIAERKEQFDCFTMAPHADTPESYAAMNASERAAIRRFDRVIAKIEDALP